MREIVAGQQTIKLFNLISVETAAVCNRKCTFCPNHGHARPDEQMPWSLIEKAARELSDLKFTGTIAPFIYNEPMRDPRLVDFIRLMKAACPRANIMTNTNGDYIKTEGDIIRLFEAGMTSLVINVYAAKDHTPLGLRLAENRYQRFAQMISPKGEGSPYLKKGVIQINRKFGNHFEGGHPKTNRSGNIEWTADSLVEPLKNSCVRPWRVANINWKGELLLCCNDYHAEVVFGNLKDRTLVEMWNDMRLHEIRMALQDRDRTTVPLCAKCDFNGGAYRHMITRVLPAESLVAAS